MVPLTIRKQLSRLQGRANRTRFVWTGARWLAVLGLTLAGTCLLDFTIDLWQETPGLLRIGLLLGQLLLWSAALTVVGPILFRRLSDSQLALWVEEKLPQFRHRLISAVQLNRPEAATRGMSAAMIAAVTREAEEQTRAQDFAALVDRRRGVWGLVLLAVVAAGVTAALLAWPQTARALLARLFLKDRPIPRSVYLTWEHGQPDKFDPAIAGSPKPNVQVWPAGEEIVLRFRATGAGVRDDLKGQIRVDAEGRRNSDRYDLGHDPQAEPGVFTARVQPMLVDFTCWAWLKDGRTHQSVRVRMEPRPVIIRQDAVVLLPKTIGQTPDGTPFEEPQKAGDIVHRLPGSWAVIELEAQKPIARAELEILGPPPPPAESTTETVRRRLPMQMEPKGRIARGRFALDPEDTGYRLRVWDENGFENSDPPRRAIRTGPIDPPLVAFKPETVWQEGDSGSPEDREVEGIPVLYQERFRLEFTCSAPYGLSHARLRYRVLKKAQESDEEAPKEPDFMPLPLGAPRGTQPTPKAREEFSTSPLIGPDQPGERGSGRYDFDTKGIPDGKGGITQLEVGDRIQFFVEVYGRADPNGAPGRSAIREKQVVTREEFLAWLERKDNQKDKIQQLEEMQRGALRLRPKP